jgi:hypothetical protein
VPDGRNSGAGFCCGQLNGCVLSGLFIVCVVPSDWGIAGYKASDRLGASFLKTETNLASETCYWCVLKYLLDYGECAAENDYIYGMVLHCSVFWVTGAINRDTPSIKTRESNGVSGYYCVHMCQDTAVSSCVGILLCPHV